MGIGVMDPAACSTSLRTPGVADGDRVDHALRMTPSAPEHARPSTPVLLLVEDDAGDALLFETLLESEDLGLEVAVSRSLGELDAAIRLHQPVVCVLDLGLPGCEGLDALHAVREIDADLPTVVLTGRDDREVGLRAMGLGAQDFLVKGQETGSTIARSIRFAIERRAAAVASAALAVAEARASDQMRLESSLLATPHLPETSVTWDSRYVVARAGVVGGDFLDCVQVSPEHVRLIVGDVAGHGPDEAALGVTLRAGWRALALNRPPEDDLLPYLDRLIDAERRAPHDFATAAEVILHLPSLQGIVRSAGHPPPHLSGTGLVLDDTPGPPLGVGEVRAPSVGTTFDMAPGHTLTLYTDGLFEVRRHEGRVGGVDDVSSVFDGIDGDATVDEVLEAAGRATTDGWRDDVAIGRLSVQR